MKKYISLIAAGAVCTLLIAQTSINFHLQTAGTKSFSLTEVDTIRFNEGIISVEKGNTKTTFATLEVDSATFSSVNQACGDTVFIHYNGEEVIIVNPQPSVEVTTNGADVAVTSTAGQKGIVYHLSGTSDNGSFAITPDRGYILCLDNLTLKSQQSAPILLNAAANGENYTANIHLRGTSEIADGKASPYKGAIQTKSKLKISDDTLYANTTLKITGNTKHAINSSKHIELYSGKLSIDGAAQDGINADAVEVYGGELTITGTTSDGIDCSEKVSIASGKVDITVEADDVKAIKCDSMIEITGGDLELKALGAGAKAIKSGNKTLVTGGTINAILSAPKAFVNPEDDTDYSYNSALSSKGEIEIGGTANITITGNGIAARAVSADQSISMNSGTLNIDLTGSYNIEQNNNDTTSVYGIKSDDLVAIKGGTLTITIGENANIAKGIKGKEVAIMGGSTTIDNNGGYWYTKTSSTTSNNSNNRGPGGGFGGNQTTTDYSSTTPKAILSDSVLLIGRGILHLTCAHGKAVVCDDELVIGVGNDNNDQLDLTIVSGVSTDPYYNASNEKTHNLRYCSPKAILSKNTVNVNAGNINITSFDSGIKGKEVYVNGGKLTISAAYDQGIHGVQKLVINDGDILVTESFEAFEGTEMIFNGGVTSVYASDDAWNCSKSTSGTGTPALTVNGGVHYLNVGSGDTDALDSNGSMSFQGGTVIIESGNVSLDCDATPAYNSNAILMLFCKNSETLPSGATSRSVSNISANTRYTAISNGTVMSTFTTTQSASQLIYISGTTPTFSSGATYIPGNEVAIRGKGNTTMAYGYGGTANGGTTLTSSQASAQGMGGGGRW